MVHFQPPGMSWFLASDRPKKKHMYPSQFLPKVWQIFEALSIKTSCLPPFPPNKKNKNNSTNSDLGLKNIKENISPQKKHPS